MNDDELDLFKELGLSDWPEVLDRDAAIDSIAAFAEIVGEMDDVSLTITSDFENQVRAHLDPKWASVFTQDRGVYGRCMAKTIPKDDGSQVVLFDVHLFLKELPSPEPTFRHEALHVVINRRGESVFDIRDKLSRQPGIHPDLIALAGIAADEYRVDRTLNQTTSQDPWPSFGPLCVAAHDAIHEASVAYFYDHDTAAIRDEVMQAFSPMTVQAAYMAAWIDTHSLPAPSLEDGELHQRMLGKPWSDVLDAFRKLRPADGKTTREEIERTVIEIGHRFDEWLKQIGFGLEVLDDNNSYFHVYEHRDWFEREPIDKPKAA